MLRSFITTCALRRSSLTRPFVLTGWDAIGGSCQMERARCHSNRCPWEVSYCDEARSKKRGRAKLVMKRDVLLPNLTRHCSVAVRPLFVIDVTHKVSENPEYVLQVSDIKQFERSHLTTISMGSVVAIRTDFSKSYSTYTTDGIPSAFPGVSLEALQFLHDTRKVQNCCDE